MLKRRLALLVIVALVAVGGLSAQEEYTMAVQVNPWGFLAGSYGANFEMLLGSSHGVLAEGNFAMSDTQTSLGGGLHYRFHPGGELATFFVGPFAKFFSSSGAVTETVGATTTEYDFTATALVFGLNIGRRWIWDPGLSLVLRGGYGYTLLNTSYPGAAPGSEDLVNLLLRFALGFDLELSVGWAF